MHESLVDNRYKNIHSTKGIYDGTSVNARLETSKKGPQRINNLRTEKKTNKAVIRKFVCCFHCFDKWVLCIVICDVVISIFMLTHLHHRRKTFTTSKSKWKKHDRFSCSYMRLMCLEQKYTCTSTLTEDRKVNKTRIWPYLKMFNSIMLYLKILQTPLDISLNYVQTWTSL